METTNLAAELYGTPDLDWGSITDRLVRGIPQAPGQGGPGRHTCWLATVDADGAPQINGIGAIWAHDAFWWETGRTSRKGRNLARDPRCSLSVATDDFDLVVQGTAELITDRDLVAEMAAAWAADGWPAEVDESGTAITAPYSAPSAGPPPWNVYRMNISSATALATVEPGGATRFRF